MPSGYSGTPLARKLGIKDHFHLLFYQRPEHYFDLFIDFPNGTVELPEPVEGKADFIHLFCTTSEELKRIIPTYKAALTKNGMMWISWPKGKSSIKTDLKRDMIREFLLESGLVDVKVAAIDDDWSGLKFVYRLEDR